MSIESSPQPPFNQALHLVRGLCALGVAAYHYLSWEHDITVESAGAFLVYVFFILSALTMMIVYARDFSKGIHFDRIADFYRRRAARILPLLLFVAIIAPSYSILLSGGELTAEILAHAYLTSSTLMGLQMPGLMSGVVAAWSLGIEAVFYLVFPILALLACHVRLRTILIATALLITAQQSAILLIRNETNPEFWFRYANPLVFSPFFAIGVVIYFRPLQVRAANFWFSIAALFLVAGFSLISPMDVYRDPVAYLFLTALAGAAVLTAYSARVPAWATKASAFLGDISYALYLTHWFAYKGSSWFASKVGVEVAQPFLFVLFAVGMAHLLFRFLEIPARDWLRGNRRPFTESAAAE
ncbi:acyltransferase [Devosia sp. BSSL-BM10]|uniref:Acyltransferase n=1 Tax=Devosia litorisediminis TaxID=2829817 RepID=A0A942I628_9HYPH|nr:acyltransferase [Devosia litorisediminis]